MNDRAALRLELERIAHRVADRVRVGRNLLGGHAHDHGDHLRGDYVYIDDYARWGLNPPPSGHTYVRKNGEILEVVKDTLAIVGAVAVVDALLD